MKPEDRFKPIIERYASENGVSIELAHAVITVESNYKVYSLGKAGEVGLMQIKPTTARDDGLFAVRRTASSIPRPTSSTA